MVLGRALLMLLYEIAERGRVRMVSGLVDIDYRSGMLHLRSSETQLTALRRVQHVPAPTSRLRCGRNKVGDLEERA
jgi:hypothetical protein